MQRNEIELIFEENKEKFFKKIFHSEKPLAILLGGQPACGKSILLKRAEKDHPNKDFLSVNGDLYRAFHPNVSELIKDSQNYSNETQIFSNVFTEKLIEEAIKRKSNIIVEGTMRNLDVPINTTNLFKKAGYTVEVYAIAAPDLITQLGVYTRFLEEINKKGVGRLADMQVHNVAVNGLPKSLDALYRLKLVDKISLYTYLAEEKIKDFSLNNNSWNCLNLPSVFVDDSRKKQIQDKEILRSCIEKGEKFGKEVSNNEIKKEMSNALQKLKSSLLRK